MKGHGKYSQDIALREETFARIEGDIAKDYTKYGPQRRLSEIVSMFHAHLQGRLLDAGCGDGIVLQALESVVRKATAASMLCGVDISQTRLKRAQKRTQAQLVKCNIERLPFPDGFFDLAICCEVLEHMDEPAIGIRELARTVKQGGLILISVPVVDIWRLMQYTLLRRPPRFFDFKHHLREYSYAQITGYVPISELIRSLRAQNLSILELRGIYFYGNIMERLISMICNRVSLVASLLAVIDRFLGQLPQTKYMGRYLMILCVKQ